ncbi:tumor necrosis factor receptor superfamily member 14-like [Pelmatolapia mariae]|uniref:tumor necrosis factor receptor superfamily member 14-like n=1 Tax=Pelmatolapia mariae TaxID=158779 RepID=UPI002FE50E17
MSSRRKPVNVAALLMILMSVFSGLSLSCHQAEYQIGNECCPKCLAGSRVKTHCNEYRSTSCLPCMEGTYTDKPNGLERCTSCTNCDSGFGLRVKTPCKATSDTVCEPLEGFYCASYVGDSCEESREHRSCKPGQYISQKGTASTDTECSYCSIGTFSNGTFYSCQPHTQCHSLIAAGTAEADAQCGETSDHVTLTVILVFVFIIAVVLGVLCYKKRGFLNLWSQTNNTPTETSFPQQATDRSPSLLAPTEPPVEALREPPMALKSNSQNSLPTRGRTRGDGSEREAELKLVLVNDTHKETDREQGVT